MRLVVILAGLLWGLTSTAYAHIGDRLFMFYELTDEDLARIDLHDGSVDDWQDLIGDPSITASSLPTIGGWEMAANQQAQWYEAIAELLNQRGANPQGS